MGAAEAPGAALRLVSETAAQEGRVRGRKRPCQRLQATLQEAMSDTAIECVQALFDSSGRLLYGPQRFEALEL